MTTITAEWKNLEDDVASMVVDVLQDLVLAIRSGHVSIQDGAVEKRMIHGQLFAVEAQGPGYEILVRSPDGERGIRCGSCQMLSFNQNDIERRFCANCDRFHEEVALAG